MSTSDLPTNMPSIERLLQRIATAEKSNTKEVRITIQEARLLAIDLALLTGRMGQTIAEINKTLQEINKNANEVDVKFDGGNF